MKIITIYPPKPMIRKTEEGLIEGGKFEVCVYPLNTSNEEEVEKIAKTIYEALENLHKKEMINLVNNIIKTLYSENGVNRAKITALGLDDEAINWGNLHCTELKILTDKEVIIFVEEASPDAYKFKQWIAEKFKQKTGFMAKVVTEW